VGSTATNANKIVANAQYLVVRGIFGCMQSSVAEGGKRVSGDGDIAILSNSDDCGHIEYPN
jgi:hypothetical protein